MNRTVPAVTHVQQPDTKLCWATCVLMAMVVKRNSTEQTRDWTPQKIVERFAYDYVNKGMNARATKAALENYGATNVTITDGAPHGM
jgi:Papain-like cysteine protease AvrRpt2